MKKCLDCSTQMDDNVFVCPNCGGKESIGSYSGDEALAALDALSTANKAERIVDEAAQLYFAGNQKAAIAKLNEALAVNPRSAMANFNMGYILLEQGKAKEAWVYQPGWVIYFDETSVVGMVRRVSTLDTPN